MRRFTFVAMASLAMLSSAAQARDTVLFIPLAEVLELPEAKQKLDADFKFYLAGSNTPKVEKLLGSDTTNKKTNGFGKSDDYGCKWVILSALIALQESGKKNGANAVVNLTSYYKKVEYKDAEKIECHAGTAVIGAALKGDYAKVK